MKISLSETTLLAIAIAESAMQKIFPSVPSTRVFDYLDASCSRMVKVKVVEGKHQPSLEEPCLEERFSIKAGVPCPFGFEAISGYTVHFLLVLIAKPIGLRRWDGGHGVISWDDGVYKNTVGFSSKISWPKQSIHIRLRTKLRRIRLEDRRKVDDLIVLQDGLSLNPMLLPSPPASL